MDRTSLNIDDNTAKQMRHTGIELGLRYPSELVIFLWEHYLKTKDNHSDLTPVVDSLAINDTYIYDWNEVSLKSGEKLIIETSLDEPINIKIKATATKAPSQGSFSIYKD